METEAERLLWEVVRHHERPPFFFPDEGVGNRLNRAARILTEGRLTPNSDGSYTVEGSGKRLYRVTDHCSCPQANQGKSKWCYHHISVVLYVEWQRRMGYSPQGLPRPTDDRPMVVLPAEPGERSARVPFDSTDDAPSPVDDQTLPLALPPVTVDERLAHMPAPPPQDGPGKEIAPMADDTYIPEPDDAPVTGVMRPTTVVTRSREAQALADSMTAWREQRQLVTQYIKEQLSEGTDYYVLRVGGRDSKPTLSKAGSEKFMALMHLAAAFEEDAATWRMLGAKEGTLCYVCRLTTRDGQVVGEGRGARTLAQDKGDINKAVKMAQKSAQIDAILRTGALSDVFTQDINEPEETQAPAPAHAPTSADLRQQIWTHIKQQAPDITGREEAGRWVKERTGYALVESNFPAILHALAVA
jgi:hypothetical protein